MINTVLNDPIIDESVADSISISPSKPKYKLLDNEVNKSVSISVESPPASEFVNISNNSSTIKESKPGRKMTSDSRLRGLFSSPSPGISHIRGSRG